MKFLSAIISRIPTLGVLAIAMASIAFAWTGPTGVAPNNNTPTLVNVGTADQVKSGGLGVSAFVANTVTPTNTVTVGTSCATNGMIAQDGTGVLLSCQSLIWKYVGS